MTSDTEQTAAGDTVPSSPSLNPKGTDPDAKPNHGSGSVSSGRSLQAAESGDSASDLQSFLTKTWVDDPNALKAPPIDLAWRDLAVTGVGAGSKHGQTILSTFYSPFLPSTIKGILRPPVKTILNPTSGSLKAGDLLLVLGRPGAGCTTFLKTLASYREGYRSVDGDVSYGGANHKTIEGPLVRVFRGGEQALLPPFFFLSLFCCCISIIY